MEVTRRRVAALLGTGVATGPLLGVGGFPGPGRGRTGDGPGGEGRYADLNDGGALESFDEPYLTAESEWSATGTGAVAHTTETVYRGDRSLKVDTDGRVEWTPPAPVDLSGVHFSLAAKLPPGTRPEGRMRIRLDDADGNTVTYTNTHSYTSAVDEEWTRLDFGLPGLDVGEVDRTRIRRLQVYTYDDPGTIYLDDLRTVERPGKAYVVLEMDNPEWDDEDWFFDLYDRYGFPFTAGVDAVAAERADNVTLDRLLAAERDGHEVTSKPTRAVIEATTGRTARYLTRLSGSQQREVVRRNKELLEAAGFRSGTHAVVYTGNNYDADTLDAVEDHHALGRTGGYGAYPSQFSTPLALPGAVTEPPDEETKRRLDRVVEENLVYHLYWHNRNVSPADIDEFFAYVREYVDDGQLGVVTYGDLVELAGLDA